jgi:hypothetical protein
MARLDEALHRRMELCEAGFRWDAHHSIWYRGRICLSDEQVDTLEPWQHHFGGPVVKLQKRLAVFLAEEETAVEA